MADELETDGSEEETEVKETLVPIAELRKVRAEAAKNRKELQEFKERIKAQEETARLSGLDDISVSEERLKKAIDDNKALTDKLNRVQVENAVIVLASTLGFVNSKDVVKLIDLTDVKDDQGNIDNDKLEVAVKKIADEKPYLRSKSSLSSDGKSAVDISKNLGTLKPKLTDQGNIDEMRNRSMELIKRGMIVEAVRNGNSVWEQTQGIKK